MLPAAALAERFRQDLARVAGPWDGPVAVAVSGGPDSLALLLLAQAALPGRVQAATVDHGLRRESAGEAAHVARICAELGVPHEGLAVAVERGGEGLQAAARSARYAALGGWMRREGLSLLLTAHHADDQAETLIMRLLRGSGVAGLAGIRAAIPFPAAGEGARLCRPLLGWRRRELEAIVGNSGLEPVRDPSNEDETYDRARLRRLIGETPWLDAASLARSAAALAEADEALEAAADRLFAERAQMEGGGATLDPADLPAELVRRLVLRCLRVIEPAAAPRGEQMTGLLAALRAGESGSLAGILCRGGAKWRFGPAPPRRR